MIDYSPLWNQLEEKGISQYKLCNDYGFSRNILARLRNNGNVQLTTISKLCEVLHCQQTDIFRITPEDTPSREEA